MQRCLLNLRDLLDEALGGVPQAVAGRCVHERASVATCRHCVTACPRDAWQLDDEQLMIDIGRCDGCGIFVAKCPEGALTQVGVSPEPYLGSVELRLSCERVTSDSGDWRLPCLHAVGPVWLTSLYRAGLRHIVWDVSHCQTCDRSNDDGLPQSVEQLNAVLAQRGLPRIAVNLRTENPGTDRMVGRIPQPGGATLSRRGFLQRMVRVTPLSDPDEPQAARKPSGDHLPPAHTGDLALCVPEIDLHRCNGCDACWRVCCHDALTYERGSSDVYRVSADACTGCRLCMDVCDRDAIRVDQCTEVRQTEIPLAVGKCRACGIRFHSPDTGRGAANLCQVCSSTNHQRNLYQVL
jgi:Pyruvate/2-oxoacid:ferredoxin oxidoreductase delta subunit